MSPMHRRLLLAGALGMGLSASHVASAQTVGNQPQASARKSGDGKVRTDLPPLAKRLPVLAKAKSVRWVGGVMGDPAMPGPSLYWIDAVVEPDAALQGSILALQGWVKASLPEDLHASLRALLPGQRQGFETAPSLNALLSHGAWQSQACFQRDSGVLVLTALGQ